MQKLVSIIIPVFNIEKYISNCLNSIIEQTYNQLQIILVDDGSTDDSGKICDEYSKYDSRIKVIHNENQGVSNARNMGLKYAKGEYILFVDGDDYIERNMIEKLVGFAVNNDAEAVIFEYNIVYPDKIIKHNVNEGYYNQIITAEKAIELTISPKNRFAWSKLYSCRIVQNIQFDETIYRGEDTWFAINALKNADKVYYTDYAPYNYIQSDNSAVRSVYSNRKYSVVVVYEKMIDFCVKNYPDLLNIAVDAYVGETIAIVYDMHISRISKKEIKALINRLKNTINCDYYKLLSNNNKLQFLLCKYALPVLCAIKDRSHK